jgi:hypothetical protein
LHRKGRVGENLSLKLQASLMGEWLLVIFVEQVKIWRNCRDIRRNSTEDVRISRTSWSLP